jgi:hypothetical protein
MLHLAKQVVREKSEEERIRNSLLKGTIMVQLPEFAVDVVDDFVLRKLVETSVPIRYVLHLLRPKINDNRFSGVSRFQEAVAGADIPGVPGDHGRYGVDSSSSIGKLRAECGKCVGAHGKRNQGAGNNHD